MNFVDGKFFATGKREGCLNLGSSGLNFFFTGYFFCGDLKTQTWAAKEAIAMLTKEWSSLFVKSF